MDVFARRNTRELWCVEREVDDSFLDAESTFLAWPCAPVLWPVAMDNGGQRTGPSLRDWSGDVFQPTRPFPSLLRRILPLGRLFRGVARYVPAESATLAPVVGVRHRTKLRIADAAAMGVPIEEREWKTGM